MYASDFGGLFPLKFWRRKHSFQLPVRHFATLLQISPDWNKISSTGKRRCKLRSRPCGFAGLQDRQGRLVKVMHKKHRYTKCLEESEQTFYAVGPRAYSLLQASNPYCDGFSPLIAPHTLNSVSALNFTLFRTFAHFGLYSTQIRPQIRGCFMHISWIYFKWCTSQICLWI